MSSISIIKMELLFHKEGKEKNSMDYLTCGLTTNFLRTALFRWATALQHRSRLRPRTSREKVKLLQQAQRLYKDALHMDSDNLQARKALSSCISELKYWYR